MTTTEQKNISIVQEAYAAFGRGDLPGLLALFTDDIGWHSAQSPEIPWGGERKGKEEVAQFFAAIGENATAEAFEPREFFARDEKVVALGYERFRIPSTGKAFETEWSHVFTFRDGKVADWREYCDTAAILAALTP